MSTFAECMAEGKNHKDCKHLISTIRSRTTAGAMNWINKRSIAARVKNLYNSTTRKNTNRPVTQNTIQLIKQNASKLEAEALFASDKWQKFLDDIAGIRYHKPEFKNIGNQENTAEKLEFFLKEKIRELLPVMKEKYGGIVTIDSLLHYVTLTILNYCGESRHTHLAYEHITDTESCKINEEVDTFYKDLNNEKGGYRARKTRRSRSSRK